MAEVMRRGLPVLLGLLALYVGQAGAQTPQTATVRIAVLSLFHPKELVLRPATGRRLVVLLDSLPRTFEPGAVLAIHAEDSSSLTLQVGDEHVKLRNVSMASEQSFEVEVPGKLRRLYRGALNLSAGNTLQPVVTMETEVAVASIVLAESPPHAPLEALKAQAIVSRSYLLANLAPGRAYDATDTTRDQFLRSPPAGGSAAASAARATAGLVLQWQPEAGASMQIVSAMYSRSCAGTTRTLQEIGRGGHAGYPFYAVRCPLHAAHPELWSRELDAVSPKNERERIAYNRAHGWEAVPAMPAARTGATIAGSGQGHGVGLCQTGAADMALHGATAERILAHYFPGTVVRR